MSLAFNDTATYRGIVQEYEKECGYEYGDVSGNAQLLASLVASVNLALDDFLTMAFKSEATWQFDDSNQSDYPIIQTNLVAGQRDYPFITDSDSNIILDIYKVFVANPTGIFVQINPVDVETGDDNLQEDYYMAAASGLLYYGGISSFTNGQNAQGTPVRYDKMANGIFLDPIPNYNYAGGLKVYVNREPSYFKSTDTTKKPGVPGNLHRYFVLKAAVDYLRRNNAANYANVVQELVKYEGNDEMGIIGSIESTFARRAKDVRDRMVAGRHNNR